MMGKDYLIDTSVFAQRNFDSLLSKKGTVSNKKFGSTLKAIYSAKTESANMETILKCFEGLKKWHIMDIKELWTYFRMPKEITIYRGTDVFENKPRLSWTLNKKIALLYCRGNGKLFQATIPKKDIIAYFKLDNEVVVHITEGYTVNNTYYNKEKGTMAVY